MNPKPLSVILKSIILLLGQRAKFPRDRVGKTILREDGQQFTIFREVRMKTKMNQPEIPGGVFRVWFSTRAAPENTVRLSYLTLFGFLGMSGFRSKLWLRNENTGEFGGIYEWDTVQDADSYDKSYAMKFSKWRSVPGKFWTDVFPQADERARIHRP